MVGVLLATLLAVLALGLGYYYLLDLRLWWFLWFSKYHQAHHEAADERGQLLTEKRFPSMG